MYLPSLGGGCKKEIDQIKNQQNQTKNYEFGTPEYYEELYDLHIQTGTFGLVDLVKRQDFRSIVINECQKQFDDDDNVLFKDLNAVLEVEGIDLETEMENSLDFYGHEDLIQHIDGLINGFDYFDTKIYMQIYIPFIENISSEDIPVIAANYNDDEVLDAYYSEGDEMASLEVDETYASENSVFVISGNESVDQYGMIPMEVRDNFNKKAEILKVYISDKKENWANGRADISYAACHARISNCSGDYYANPLAPIIKISNNQLNTWRTVNNSLATFALQSTPPSSYWSSDENIVIMFYERDIRPKFGKQTFPLGYINYNFCTSG